VGGGSAKFKENCRRGAGGVKTTSPENAMLKKSRKLLGIEGKKKVVNRDRKMKKEIRVELRFWGGNWERETTLQQTLVRKERKKKKGTGEPNKKLSKNPAGMFEKFPRKKNSKRQAKGGQLIEN